MDFKIIGKKIKERRKILRLSTQELGERVGVHHTTISRYEAGQVAKLDYSKLEKIADALQVSLNYFLDTNSSIDLNEFDFVVKDNSMYPYLEEKDTCYLLSTDEIINDRLFLVSVNGNKMIRKINNNGNTLLLIPLNSEYPIQSFNKTQLRENNVKILGRLLRFTRFL